MPVSTSSRSGSILAWVEAQQQQQSGTVASQKRSRSSNDCLSAPGARKRRALASLPPTPSPTNSQDVRSSRKRTRSMSEFDESGVGRREKRLRGADSEEEIDEVTNSQASSIPRASQTQLAGERPRYVDRHPRLNSQTSTSGSRASSASNRKTFPHTPFQCLEENSIQFAAWDAAPASIKKSAETILSSYETSQSVMAVLETQATQIGKELRRQELNEMSFTAEIMGYILPSIDPDSRLRQDFNATFTCRTEPQAINRPVRWVPITTPRADKILGYNYIGQMKSKILNCDESFGAIKIKTVTYTVAAQLVVELKSSCKGGSVAAALAQTAGASATCSNSLAYLHDSVQSISELPNVALLRKLRDCLVFGLIIDEYAAYVTVTWRHSDAQLTEGSEGAVSTEARRAEGAEHSRGQGEPAANARLDEESGPVQDVFHCAMVSCSPLYLQAERVKFLRQVEGIKLWIDGRYGTVIEALDALQ